MPRLRESQRTCYRADCKEKWRQKTVQSHFLGTTSASVKDPIKTSIKQGVKEADKYGRRWHIVAGTIGSTTFHCATVPDGPGCRWESGSFERIEAENRRALKAHFAKLKVAEQAEIEANGEFTEPEWREVTSPDGVVCFVTRFCDPGTPAATKTTSPIPDDLSIPAFLDRRVGDERR